MKVINYSNKLVIKNTESLPAGTGAKFLIVIDGLNGEYIAKQWKRTKPDTLKPNETLIQFK